MTEVLVDQPKKKENILLENSEISQTGKLPKNRKFQIEDFEIKKEVGKGTYG